MSLVFLCVRNLHAEHVRNQNGQINCKIILIYICIFFFKFTVIIPTSGCASYPLCAFMSNCVKLTPVFHPCSQIITLSTQSVTSSGRDGELQFPTKPTYARASQIQSKGLSAVSSNLLLFQAFSPSFQPAQQIRSLSGAHLHSQHVLCLL